MTQQQHPSADDNEFGRPAFKRLGLEQVLDWHQEAQPFIVDGLVREGSVTVFLVDPRINVRHFPIDLAMAAAAGTAIQPFGLGAAVPTVLYLPDGDANDDSQTIRSLFARVGAPPVVRRLLDNFSWCHGSAMGGKLPQLNKSDGQQAFMRSLPESCKLAVLVNPSPYLAEGPDPMNDAKLNALLARLTKAGVAVAIFETAAKPSTTASAYVTSHHELIRLKYDPAAPVDLGEGFAITRPKPLCGKSPSTLHLWYAEHDGLIASGWDGGLEDREVVGKQMEMREREQRILRMYADHEARGLPKPTQKSIAEFLQVDPATITRDMQAIRRRYKTQEKQRAALRPKPKDPT